MSYDMVRRGQRRSNPSGKFQSGNLKMKYHFFRQSFPVNTAVYLDGLDFNRDHSLPVSCLQN
jgi:hypothetical protein